MPRSLAGGSPHLLISEEDIDKLASAARELEPSASVYLEQDFVMNQLATVLDYMLQTEVVVKALEHFRQKRWNEALSLDDLERLMARFPDDQAGNTALAQQLWGYNFWTRAQQPAGARPLLPQHRRDRPRAAQTVGTAEHVQGIRARLADLGGVPRWRVSLPRPSKLTPQLGKPKGVAGSRRCEASRCQKPCSQLGSPRQPKAR